MSQTLLALLTTLFFTLSASAFDHAHAGLEKVLKARVKDGLVDYAALKAAPADLHGYLEELAAVKETEFAAWSEPQRLAFLFNLYNAATLKLITDHYPIASIKKIGGLFSGPWKQEVVRAWGRVFTLDELEHGIIRAQYHEPRAHFALVCAAVSCPPLRAEPYVADRLNAQLTDQGKVFFAQRDKNRADADAHVLWLSPIFKWFTDDFTAGGKTLTDFALPYLPEADAKAVKQGGFKIKHTDYNWSLNDRAAKQ